MTRSYKIRMALQCLLGPKKAHSMSLLFVKNILFYSYILHPESTMGPFRPPKPLTGHCISWGSCCMYTLKLLLYACELHYKEKVVWFSQIFKIKNWPTWDLRGHRYDPGQFGGSAVCTRSATANSFKIRNKKVTSRASPLGAQLYIYAYVKYEKLCQMVLTELKIWKGPRFFYRGNSFSGRLFFWWLFLSTASESSALWIGIFQVGLGPLLHILVGLNPLWESLYSDML